MEGVSSQRAFVLCTGINLRGEQGQIWMYAPEIIAVYRDPDDQASNSILRDEEAKNTAVLRFRKLLASS